MSEVGFDDDRDITARLAHLSIRLRKARTVCVVRGDQVKGERSAAAFQGDRTAAIEVHIGPLADLISDLSGVQGQGDLLRGADGWKGDGPSPRPLIRSRDTAAATPATLRSAALGGRAGVLGATLELDDDVARLTPMTAAMMVAAPPVSQ